LHEERQDQVDVDVGNGLVRIGSQTFEADDVKAAALDTSWGGINKFGFALVIVGGPLLAFLAPVGVAMIVLGLVLITRRSYSVRLRTSTGTQRIMQSKDKGYAERVVQALRDALTNLVQPANATAAPVMVRYDRVGGWLLLLCVILTVIAPAYSLLTTAGALGEAGPYLSMLPASVLAMLTMDLTVVILIVGLGIYAGIGLWRIRPGALRIAKAFLVAVLIVTLTEILIIGLLDIPDDFKQMALSEGAMAAIRTSVFFAVWFTYLTRSKRVRATYGGLESTERESELPADAVYECPSCSEGLELEQEELERREFTCPVCGVTAVL
jgi:hypothetical protein